MKLLIITPFKNEEKSIYKTIESIISQDCPPVKWLLIDDSSDDESPAIVKKYAESVPFIQYELRVKAGSSRATGSNIVDMFNYGLNRAIELNIEWDVVLKLDADIVIQNSDYLRYILGKFEQFPELGIASGATFIISPSGEKVIESKHKWHTQGPNKFYRKKCLEEIGGLRPFKGWDGVDDILARDRGYVTEKFFEQLVHHLYPTQTRTSEGGEKRGLMREAAGYRNMGYPFFMYIFKSAKLAKDRSLYSGFMFFYYGVKSTLTSRPLVSKAEARAVRKFMVDRVNNKFKYTG